MAVIGLDLGGTKLAAAIFATDGRMLRKQIVTLGQRTGAAVGELVRSQIEELLGVARKEGIGVEAVGVSVPGISHSQTGKVWAPNIPGWDDYPLRTDILAAFKEEPITATIDSDRACYILGEAWQGAARGCANAIFLAVGTGIGAGIMINGEILRGANDIAGAIGWLALDRPFEPKYVSCGCFEHHASGAGLVKVAKELLAKDKRYAGPLRNKADLIAHDIFEAHASNDPVAAKVLVEAIEYWGMATANLVSLFNPEKIIFGGGVFGPGAQFLNVIYTEASKWAQPISIRQVKFEASQLGGDAGLVGAGCLALRSLGENR